MSPVSDTARIRRSDVVLAVCLMVCIATVVTGLVANAGLTVDFNPYDTFQYALGFPSVLVGAYVAYRAPRHAIGWAMMFAGWGAWAAATAYAVLTRNWVHTEWVARTVFGIGTMGWVWCRGVLFGVVPMLYPSGDAFTGRASPLRRVMAWVAALVVANACLFQAMTQVPIDFATGRLPSWTTFFQDWIVTSMRAVWVMALVAIVDLVVRMALLGGEKARRHRPIAIASALLTIPPLIEFGADLGIGDGLNLGWVEFAALTLFLLVLAYGIVRGGVLGFQTVIRRTALYGGVTLVAAAIYVAVVAIFAAALQEGVGRGPIVATGMVAVSLQPVRAMVQRVVDRFVFGDRDEPYRALVGLSRRLGDTSAGGEPLSVVAEAVRSSLRLPAVVIEVAGRNGGPVAAAQAEGRRHGGEFLERVPVLYEGHAVATMIVAVPAGEQQLGAVERDLLDDLAGIVGAVVQSALLADDLAASRGRLVRAREEERRRLRHDLHDGLGPTLASVAMGLDAAASRLADDPELAALLRDLDRALQEAITDIRRVVYGLRPPALDDLGLVAGLREQARDIGARTRRSDGSQALTIDVLADDVPPIAAAVEVAAYRIAVEGMTNVLRHSGASHCTVRLTAGAGLDAMVLEVMVEDDGCGMDLDGPTGVGFESMYNRAEELGGDVRVGRRATGGTLLVATLPLHDRVRS
jgi:signal transduction histidine kinase